MTQQKKHTLIVAIVMFASFVASPLHAADAKKPTRRHSEVIKAGAAIGTGAAIGGVASAWLGTGGLVIAGTGLAIGTAPFVAAGAVVGLAGYGVYRIFE